MSKFLYFTRSNGDIDNISVKSVTKFGLTTAVKIKKFIGDQGASRFKLQEALSHPSWNADNKEYVVDIVLKDQYTQDKASTAEREDLLKKIVTVIKGMKAKINSQEARIKALEDA